MLTEIQALYRSYTDKVIALELSRKPTDGLFGMGPKISDDPCHDDFTKQLEALLARFAESSPAPSEVREVLRYIYRYPAEHSDPVSVYWMTTGVHGLTLGAVKLLDAESAAELREEYISAYPKLRQLPVQKKVCRALKEICNKKSRP